MKKVRANTAVLSTRLDHRTLATIYKWYQSEGANIKSKSELLAQAVQDFCEILITNEVVKPVTELDMAIQVLNMLDIKTQKKNLIEALDMNKLVENNKTESELFDAFKEMEKQDD